MRDQVGVVLDVQAVVSLITSEGLVTRQFGPQLFSLSPFFLPTHRRNAFYSLRSLYAFGGIGMGTGAGMGKSADKGRSLGKTLFLIPFQSQ